MKVIPLLLAVVLLVPTLYVGKADKGCHSAPLMEAEACHADEASHACCKGPVEQSHNSNEENSCADGCSCFCCVHVIAQVAIDTPQPPPQQRGHQNSWQVSTYDHEFNPPIWQPPQQTA